MHGSTLEERCVCKALVKEGSCFLTAEYHDAPKILGFHGTVDLFKELKGGHPSFSFFSVGVEPGL